MPVNWVIFFSPGLRRRNSLVLLQSLASWSADLVTFSISDTRAVSNPGLGDASSYMHTIAPCPGASFIGAPVIACASSGLNSEHGSICALGDCGCVSLLEAADDGDGV